MHTKLIPSLFFLFLFFFSFSKRFFSFETYIYNGNMTQTSNLAVTTMRTCLLLYYITFHSFFNETLVTYQKIRDLTINSFTNKTKYIPNLEELLE